MSKMAKIWLMIAASLVVLGGSLFAGVMMAYGWDFTRLSTVSYETRTYDITDWFEDISVETNTADVIFLPSGDETCRVVCREEENLRHFVSVQEAALRVSLSDTKKWYERIGISFGSTSITVYLPERQYVSLFVKGSTGDVEIPGSLYFESIDVSASTGDVNCYASAADIRIKLSTGDIRLEDVFAGSMDLSVSTGRVFCGGVECEGDIGIRASTGDVLLTDVSCGSLTSGGSTGDISMENLVAKHTIHLERSTGDVTFAGCDAREIFVQTDTGDVTGSLLTDKQFIAETDTGKVDVPQNNASGKCEIHTDTGDIQITVL